MNRGSFANSYDNVIIHVNRLGEKCRQGVRGRDLDLREWTLAVFPLLTLTHKRHTEERERERGGREGHKNCHECWMRRNWV